MKIEGNKPTQGTEGRRFTAARGGAPKEAGKSFGDLVKKAAAEPGTPAAAAPAPVASAAPAAAQAPAAKAADAKPQDAPAKEGDTSFADHMETVRFRLKTGYYSSKAIDDALSDKLTGYFDELA